MQKLTQFIFAILLIAPIISQRCIQRCKFKGEYVCASSGITYPSKCHARCADDKDFVEGKCRGSCDCLEEFEPVCGVNGVTYRNACEANCLGVDLLDNWDGPCECNCLPIREPVCGNNQVTYLNVCVAGCYNIGVMYFGPCEEFPRISAYPRLLSGPVNPMQRPFRFLPEDD